MKISNPFKVWIRRTRISDLIEREVVKERRRMADEHAAELLKQRLQLEENFNVELQIKESQIAVLRGRIESLKDLKTEIERIYREAVTMLKKQRHFTADIGYHVEQMFETNAKTLQAFLGIQQMTKEHEEEVLARSHKNKEILEKAII